MVNNDTISNDTTSYFSGMVDFEKETNSELLETNKLELPTSGDSARGRWLERAYVGDDTNETTCLPIAHLLLSNLYPKYRH